jgi:two-component system osmolarity sensor histidine kinase EnvZ
MLVPGVRAIDLRDLRNVNLTVDTRHGLLLIRFDRRQVSASNPHQLLVLMAATSLLMTVIAIIFLRNQLRPIRRLAIAAEAFGRGRMEPYRPTGATEVRIAGNAFLDMRNRIERQIEQRTLLLSGVSHDLRTPLTRLRLGLSMIDDEEAPALIRDADEMQRMLDAFLEFARGTAESDPPEAIDPVLFVQEIVADYRRMGQKVSLAGVSGDGTALINRIAIRRALDNLIGNALRYGSRAELSVTTLDRAVRFTVEDDGPGIPRERRDEALRPFTRLDAARNQNRGGSVGLGLSITADIVRSHGGALRLGESERLGGLKAEIVLGR